MNAQKFNGFAGGVLKWILSAFMVVAGVFGQRALKTWDEMVEQTAKMPLMQQEITTIKDDVKEIKRLIIQAVK